MRFLLIGAHQINAGPSNVNRSLIMNADHTMDYIKSASRLLKYIEIIWKILKYDHILVSGIADWKLIRLLQFFHKDFYYLMHGCIEFENKINKLHLSRRAIEGEKIILKNAKKIICVSEGYAEWVKNRYPEYTNKIMHVNNGIVLQQRPKVKKEPFSIAVAGGNRCIKNNGEVYRAVKKMNREGIPCKLYVFGRIYPDNDKFINNENVIYCHHLDKKEYYKKLDKIACFVMDSEVESFGLVVADALNCNCSLLMSQYVGSRYIMKTQADDIIQNPHDIQELATKIQKALEHPNADRLFRTIDIEACSEKHAYENIKKIVER